MKQYRMFKDEEKKSKYSTKIDAPVYKPKGEKPSVLSLLNDTKCNRLINEVMSSGVSEYEKNFLCKAAYRHIIFNYETIAEYYCHASKEMQTLMEKSGLVIIDFEKAIENGFVKINKEIRRKYLEEYR